MLRAVMLVALLGAVWCDNCPQGTCDSTQTCCPGPVSGVYGCCPEQNAVCCSDHLHCCPENTVCNLDAGTCDSNLIPHIFRKKVVATSLEEASKVEVIYCPGGQYYCPDGNTCCMLPTGQWGCCPYPLAQCCPDKVHCCPNGTHCDSTSMYCNQGKDKFHALFKRPAHAMQ